MEQKIDDIFDWLDAKGRRYMTWFMCFAIGYFAAFIIWG